MHSGRCIWEYRGAWQHQSTDAGCSSLTNEGLMHQSDPKNDVLLGHTKCRAYAARSEKEKMVMVS